MQQNWKTPHPRTDWRRLIGSWYLARLSLKHSAPLFPPDAHSFTHLLFARLPSLLEQIAVYIFIYIPPPIKQTKKHAQQNNEIHFLVCMFLCLCAASDVTLFMSTVFFLQDYFCDRGWNNKGPTHPERGGLLAVSLTIDRRNNGRENTSYYHREQTSPWWIIRQGIPGFGFCSEGTLSYRPNAESKETIDQCFKFFFSSYLESKVNEVDLRVPGETILMIQYI